MINGIPNFEDYLVLLVIRDPRDILVSHYFSTAYSHPLPGQAKLSSFMERRQFALSSGVDDYVLAMSKELQKRYERYLDLVDKPNVHLTTYEHMIQDFPSWLDDVLIHCELDVSTQLKYALIKEADAAHRTKEDVSQHRRRVIPGDHKRKLQQETVDRLNATFSSVLVRFGYE